jgi:hypothetical protein
LESDRPEFRSMGEKLRSRGPTTSHRATARRRPARQQGLRQCQRVFPQLAARSAGQGGGRSPPDAAARGPRLRPYPADRRILDRHEGGGHTVAQSPAVRKEEQVKPFIRASARVDILRQYRYYLDQNLPDVAERTWTHGGRTQKSNSLKSVTKALLSLRWPSAMAGRRPAATGRRL